MEAGSAVQRVPGGWRLWAVVPVLLLALAVGIVVSSGSSLANLVGTNPPPADEFAIRRVEFSPGEIRILVGKPGLDGHDRGAKIVARALSDAGFEVIYTGLHQTPEMIAAAAVQEDVDAVGLSIMSGAHMTLFPAVIEALKSRGAGDVTVFGGGIVPKDDLPKLSDMGVAKIFTPGASTHEIVDWVESYLRPKVA